MDFHSALLPSMTEPSFFGAALVFFVWFVLFVVKIVVFDFFWAVGKPRPSFP
jgi:hypothetical protein